MPHSNNYIQNQKLADIIAKVKDMYKYVFQFDEILNHYPTITLDLGMDSFYIRSLKFHNPYKDGGTILVTPEAIYYIPLPVNKKDNPKRKRLCCYQDFNELLEM